MDQNQIYTPTPKQPINWKVIMIVLAVVVVAEIGWGVWSLTLGSGKSQPVKTSNQQTSSTTDSTLQKSAQPAKLTLTTQSSNIKVGDVVKVDILIDTGGRATDGTDLILNFDPKVLSVKTASASAKDVPISTGTVYSSFPKNSLDPGKISLSGISGLNNSFTGQGLLGSVNFTALLPGQTAVAIDFGLGKTSDSNVIESKTNQDILSEVSNLNLNIKP